jgi:hypothetical protein
MSGVTVLKRQCHKIFCFIAWSPISFPVSYTLTTNGPGCIKTSVMKKINRIYAKNCRRNNFFIIRIQKTSFYVKLERGVARTK